MDKIKNQFGYTPAKIKAKADKRGVSPEAYLHYLQFRQATRGGRSKD